LNFTKNYSLFRIFSIHARNLVLK